MEQASAPTFINTTVQRSWLLPVRVFWLAASLIALGLFVAGLPPRAKQIDYIYRGDIQAWITQDQTGEIVLSPWHNAAAAQAGVLEDDVLLAVNDIPVTSLEQADALLAGAIGTPVIVSVRTGDFPLRQLTVRRASEVGSILLAYGLSRQFAVFFVLAGEILFTILCVVVASVIFWHRSDDWMALFSSLIITVILVGLSRPVLSLTESLRDGQNPYGMDVWFTLAFGLLILFFYLFPSGRFLSRLTLYLAVVLGLWLTLGLFNRSQLMWNLPRLTYLSVAIGWIASGLISLLYRYRHSDSFHRQQIRWIMWGAAASAIGLMLQIFPPEFGLAGSTRVLYDFVLFPLGQFLKACLPLSIAFAILRYRLWNIELAINRVLVYGFLSILTMLAYLGSVFVMQALFTGLSNPVISFVATGLVAILFEPLRRHLQRLVNRWMYGERDDPYAVLTRLAGALEHIPSTHEVLPSIAQTIGQSLKIPYVAILLDQDGEEKLAASFGTQTSNPVSFPLIYQGETIGALHVARRAAQEEFSEADRRLIQNIAHQAGAAAQTIRLQAELIRSRAQIVHEREDERLRIRRDLHDELGPILASQGLKLSAARQLIRTKPEKAERLVDDVMQQSQQTVSDVRRLVHGLRPPVLDQLGLVEAVRDLARYSDSDMTIQVSGSENEVPKLSAAAEVNAYRIVLEALTNAAKHAHAKQCTVQFETEPDELVIQIQDDGVGMPKEYRAGVGLRSMRLRAAEIGGRLTIEAVPPHGTKIIARLPLSV